MNRMNIKKKDFFGRVKNKAGDMEKILKEKDKHGLLINSFCFS